METTSWLKQTPDKPLFPDLLWSRPENKRSKGKLLIIGGSVASFAAPATAYSAALNAGAGNARVLLPAKLKMTLGPAFADAEFAPNNPSGSFSRLALDNFLDNAAWADGVLLAGDVGKNSETAIVLDSFLDKYKGQLVLAGDSVDYFEKPNSLALGRDDTLIVADVGQLQKLAKGNRPSTPILHNMNLSDLVSVLVDWSNGSSASFITYFQGSFVVASAGRVSTSPAQGSPHWQTKVATYASVWWLQNPTKPFEALTTAVHCLGL
jgi:ADP-dependent NAD(P)H-hydrate dehydratase / NAD(P)H-hydrate epimerase